jgi:hypothetical protein
MYDIFAKSCTTEPIGMFSITTGHNWSSQSAKRTGDRSTQLASKCEVILNLTSFFNFYFEYGRIDKPQIMTVFNQTTLNNNFVCVRKIEINSTVC